jgi:hypothetical protein
MYIYIYFTYYIVYGKEHKSLIQRSRILWSDYCYQVTHLTRVCRSQKPRVSQFGQHRNTVLCTWMYFCKPQPKIRKHSSPLSNFVSMLIENEKALEMEYPDDIPGPCTSSNGVTCRSKVLTDIFISTDICTQISSRALGIMCSVEICEIMDTTNLIPKFHLTNQQKYIKQRWWGNSCKGKAERFRHVFMSCHK